MHVKGSFPLSKDLLFSFLSLSLTHADNWDNDGALTLLSSHRGERMVRRSQERIDSSGLAFKYIWWCKSYIWLSYKLSLYIFSLLLISKILLCVYCRHKQCHTSSRGWKGKKKWCQLISVGKSPTEELTWGCVWVEACIEFENPHHTLSKARVSVSITSSFFISFIVLLVTLYWPVLQ